MAKFKNNCRIKLNYYNTTDDNGNLIRGYWVLIDTLHGRDWRNIMWRVKGKELKQFRDLLNEKGYF